MWGKGYPDTGEGCEDNAGRVSGHPVSDEAWGSKEAGRVEEGTVQGDREGPGKEERGCGKLWETESEPARGFQGTGGILPEEQYPTGDLPQKDFAEKGYVL